MVGEAPMGDSCCWDRYRHRSCEALASRWQGDWPWWSCPHLRWRSFPRNTWMACGGMVDFQMAGFLRPEIPRISGTGC